MAENQTPQETAGAPVPPATEREQRLSRRAAFFEAGQNP